MGGLSFDGQIDGQIDSQIPVVEEGEARAQLRTPTPREREFFIDNLLVRVHFIIVMIRWTGLAPWEFEFPFPGSQFLLPAAALSY